MFRVIRIIVDSGHRTQLVETLDEHAFRIHIGKAEGTNNLCHSLLASPVLNGLKKSPAHLDIIDEVDPSKTNALAFPFLIGSLIDNACDASYELAILICHEIFGFAELESSVFFLTQRMELIAE